MRRRWRRPRRQLPLRRPDAPLRRPGVRPRRCRSRRQLDAHAPPAAPPPPPPRPRVRGGRVFALQQQRRRHERQADVGQEAEEPERRAGEQRREGQFEEDVPLSLGSGGQSERRKRLTFIHSNLAIPH